MKAVSHERGERGLTSADALADESARAPLMQFLHARHASLQLASDDEYLSRMMVATLDKSSLTVDNLTADLAEPHAPELQMHCAHACITLPLKTQSGWFIYNAVMLVETTKVGAMQESRLAKFEAKVYFRAGMSYEAYVHQLA